MVLILAYGTFIYSPMSIQFAPFLFISLTLEYTSSFEKKQILSPPVVHRTCSKNVKPFKLFIKLYL